MIKKYSTSSIGSVYKVSNNTNLKCVKCGADIEVGRKISVAKLISPEEKDPTICSKCKQKEQD